MPTQRTIPATIQASKVLRVAAYCRVSSDSRDQMHSYATQIRAYTKLITGHSGWELVDIYADAGLTGTRMDKRDEFNRMLEDCRKGKIDKILVKSTSRFARNTRDCLAVLRQLKQINVTVQFEDDHIDTETLTSEMMVSVFGSIAQQESMSISRNLRMSYQRRMEKGLYITNCAPYGYRLVNKNELEIDPTEAPHVKWIFDAYLQGESMEKIADQLNQRRLPAPFGVGQWYVHTVHYILCNEKYIGDSLCQKQITTGFPFHRQRNLGQQPQYYVKNSHPAILSRDVYERAQALRRGRMPSTPEKQMNQPLRGKIICGNCKKHFVRKVSETGYTFFVCQSHRINKKLCGVGRIPERALHDGFVRMYNLLSENADALFEPAFRQMESLREAAHRNSPELAQLNMEIADVSEQSHRLNLLAASEGISLDVCTAKQRILDGALKTLKAKRSALLRNDVIDAAAGALHALSSTLQSGSKPLTQFDAGIFESLVDVVIVDSATSVRFRLRNGLELRETLRRKER